MPLPVAAVVLAGGMSSRMGTDKAFVELAGRPLIAHVVDRLSAQADLVAINTNAPADRFADFGLEVIADPVPGRPGPLAGVLAAMVWAGGVGAERVVTAAIDTPLLPSDLIDRFQRHRGPSSSRGPLVARTADGDQPVVASWPVALADTLARDLAAGSAAKVIDWADRHGAERVDFTDDADAATGAFVNVNTPADLARVEAHLRTHHP